MKDSADPLDGWSLPEILKQNARPASNDVYGKLYRHLFELLQSFHRSLSARPFSFRLLHMDASDLADHLRDAVRHRCRPAAAHQRANVRPSLDEGRAQARPDQAVGTTDDDDHPQSLARRVAVPAPRARRTAAGRSCTTPPAAGRAALGPGPTCPHTDVLVGTAPRPS